MMRQSACWAAMATLSLLVGCDWDDVPFVGDAPPASNPTPYVKFKQQLGELKMQRNRVTQAIERLDRDRSRLKEEARREGIRTVSDVDGHPRWRLLAREFGQIKQQRQRLAGLLGDYERAIELGETKLRQMEREIRTGGVVTDQDIEALLTMRIELEDELDASPTDPLADFELREALSEALRD